MIWRLHRDISISRGQTFDNEPAIWIDDPEDSEPLVLVFTDIQTARRFEVIAAEIVADLQGADRG